MTTSSSSSLTISSPALASAETKSVGLYSGRDAHRGAEKTAPRMKSRRKVAYVYWCMGVCFLLGSNVVVCFIKGLVG